MKTKSVFKLSLAATAAIFAGSAFADPITIEYLGDGVSDDGGNVGGYDMTKIDQQTEATDVDCINSTGVTGTRTAGSSSGNICFTGQGGAASDIDIVNNPLDHDNNPWWEYGSHGNVYVTNMNWIEILLPANTYAVSLWVGASFNGTAWIEAHNSNGDSFKTSPNFSVGPGNTKGYGIYSSNSCHALTKIIVEPHDWGFGHMSISQDDPCVEVPEPAPMALILLGLLGLGASRFQKT